MNSSVFVYKDLINLFVEKEITAEQFEKEYLKLFKYNGSRSEKVYEILNPYLG
ncbi:MAG TPA: colicin immunity domain-containing protein [Thermodesulfovibrionia bacterium]|nr:colicin immunity domain-containing protein [Thermodesulfovibrionia bacterium]